MQSFSQYDESGDPFGGSADDGTWYDTALICTEGHLISSFVTLHPWENAARCEQCGSVVMATCLNGHRIKGGRVDYHRMLSRTAYTEYPLFRPPNYCRDCGRPYPWIEEGLKVASEVIQNSDLNEAERIDFEKSLKDITTDNVRTSHASSKILGYLKRFGKGTRETLENIIAKIAVDLAKEAMKGG